MWYDARPVYDVRGKKGPLFPWSSKAIIAGPFLVAGLWFAIPLFFKMVAVIGDALQGWIGR